MSGTSFTIPLFQMPPSYAGQTVDVDIYDGVALVTTISANIFRPDLVKAGIGNGYHGFLYSVDGLLKDGQPHSIRVRFAGWTEAWDMAALMHRLAGLGHDIRVGRAIECRLGNAVWVRIVH